MAEMLIHLAVTLRGTSPSGFPRSGVLFHRWLPAGIDDAIEVNTGTPNARLRFWFERCGYVDEAGSSRTTKSVGRLPRNAWHCKESSKAVHCSLYWSYQMSQRRT